MEVNMTLDKEVTGEAQTEFADLILREVKRTEQDLSLVEEYVIYTDHKKVTSVLLFDNKGDFLGAGVSIKSPADKFNLENGVRIAARKALRSITAHRKKANGKRVHMNA